jgi:antitoxin (DNA-binding transcriptional repressor) of toxin-antitoxin stability system
MEKLPISEFKATCIATLKRIRKTGVPVVVTLRGEPLVTIGAFSTPPAKARLGTLADRTRLKGDLVRFAGTGDWESSK